MLFIVNEVEVGFGLIAKLAKLKLLLESGVGSTTEIFKSSQ